jgi:hypothetical protein
VGPEAGAENRTTPPAAADGVVAWVPEGAAQCGMMTPAPHQ